MGKRMKLFLVALLSGCLPPSDNCTPRTTRCSSNVAQICSSGQRWETIVDCDSIEPANLNWRCCITNGDYTCMPEANCHE